MNAVQWVVAGLGALVGLYLIARLVSAAYFKSRDEFERRRNKHVP